MATGTGYFFTKAVKSLLNKEIDIDTDSIVCALTTDVPAQHDDQYSSEITWHSTNTGYTGPIACTSITVTLTTEGVIKVDSPTSPVWTASTESIVAAYAVLYDDTPASNKPLLCYYDFGGTETATDGNTFTITFDSSGMFQGSVTT